jgi:hypothetical protein
MLEMRVVGPVSQQLIPREMRGIVLLGKSPMRGRGAPPTAIRGAR